MKSVIATSILVGLGCSGASVSLDSAVCEPVGATTGQLDTLAVGTLVVSPDEKHVAYLRNPHIIGAGCISRGDFKTLGTLIVLDLSSDASACARAVADNVDTNSIHFSGDSQSLVFMNDVDECGVGKLKTANADGTNARLVHGAASNDVAFGSTVFFVARSEDRYLAASMAAGKTVSIGKWSALGQGVASPNPTGTAFAYISYRTGDQGGEEIPLILITLPSGASHTLVDGVASEAGNYVWAPRGDWLAFCYGPQGMTATSLDLVAADGSKRTKVSSNATCEYALSPDSTWLAYTESDGSGVTRLMTYSLNDRRTIVLGTLPSGYASIDFSADGTSVIVVASSPDWAKESIYAATIGATDSLQFLVDFIGNSDGVVSAGGFVAVQTVPATAPAKVEVYPASGGTPVTLTGTEPRFEPGVLKPRLLLRQDPMSETGAVIIAAGDGSAATTRTVPDFVSFASWLGSVAIYGTVPNGGEPTSISALTNAGAASTLLAGGVGAYAWAPSAAPTRLFYSRVVATDDGPVGAFAVDLPR